jgi:hypothetical protein
MTPTSLKTFTENLSKQIRTATATPSNPKQVGANWQFPTGYSQSDLIDPTHNYGVLIPNPNFDSTQKASVSNPAKIANTLKVHVPSYGDVVTQLLRQLPVETPTSHNAIIKMVQANPNYSTPGVNGRPFETYGQYFQSAKEQIGLDAKNNVASTVANLVARMVVSGVYPDHKMLLRAATAAIGWATSLGPGTKLPSTRQGGLKHPNPNTPTYSPSGVYTGA